MGQKSDSAGTRPAARVIGMREDQSFHVGHIEIHPLLTQGHTDHHHAFLIGNGTHRLLFCGDTQLIDACGRTDFQSGDAATLYRSIHAKFFSLPDETLVYPCHDYDGRRISSIGQEKARNPRLSNGKTLEEFVAIMDGMDLPYPRKIDFAVPGNRLCGECPPDVPSEYNAPCQRHEQGRGGVSA